MTACNIVELTEDESKFLLLGSSKNDLAYAESGSLDSGYRTLLRLDVVAAGDFLEGIESDLKILIEREDGHVIRLPGEEILTYFSSPDQALACANAMAGFLSRSPEHAEFSLGILTDQILDPDSAHLFDEAKQRLQSLARLGLDNHIFVDEDTLSMAEQSDYHFLNSDTKVIVLSPKKFSFLIRALSVVEAEMPRIELTVTRFAFLLGVSKATAYRTLTALLDLSPREFIQHIRLHKSLELLKSQGTSVAEVAYEVGFSSPSYFTRAFKARYGMLPSERQQKG